MDSDLDTTLDTNDNDTQKKSKSKSKSKGGSKSKTRSKSKLSRSRSHSNPKDKEGTTIKRDQKPQEEKPKAKAVKRTTKKIDNVELLGEGTFGRVSKAMYHDKMCAVKINMCHDWVKWGSGMINIIEYDILKRLRDHPLFLNLYQVYNRDSDFIKQIDEQTIAKSKEQGIKIYTRKDQDLDNIHFVLELGNRSLSNLIEDDDVDLTMDHIAKIMCDILLGLEFMHMNNIIHRDLKPNNVIIFEEDGDYKAKICDFGMSKYYTPQDKNAHNVATYNTRSPELVMKKKYGTPTDVWMAGAILYDVLFNDTLIDLLEEKNKKGKKEYRFDVRKALISLFEKCKHNLTTQEINAILTNMKLQKVSQINFNKIETRVQAMDPDIFFDVYTQETLTELLESMLEFNPDKRLTASQALELPFFDGPGLREYIQDARAFNTKLNMLGRDLKITKCKARTKMYNLIKSKYVDDTKKHSVESTSERIDIHTLIMFERWLRAMYKKVGENLDKKVNKNFELYYMVVVGISEKLFTEGGSAPEKYSTRVMALEDQYGSEYRKLEEELVLDILQFPYETTPYEIAVSRGLQVKGALFNAIIDYMQNYDKEVMDMNLIVDRAHAKVKKETTRAVGKEKTKTRLPRNRK